MEVCLVTNKLMRMYGCMYITINECVPYTCTSVAYSNQAIMYVWVNLCAVSSCTLKLETISSGEVYPYWQWHRVMGQLILSQHNLDILQGMFYTSIIGVKSWVYLFFIAMTITGEDFKPLGKLYSSVGSYSCNVISDSHIACLLKDSTRILQLTSNSCKIPP